MERAAKDVDVMPDSTMCTVLTVAAVNHTLNLVSLLSPRAQMVFDRCHRFSIAPGRKKKTVAHDLKKPPSLKKTSKEVSGPALSVFFFQDAA
jgi:hypothetical protein